MRILLAGAAGQLGSNLALDLIAEGHFVTGVDNYLTGRKENIGELQKQDRFSFIEVGIESPGFLDALRGGGAFDEIYHLACPTGVPNIEKMGEEMIDACSIGTKNVLACAREHNAKLIFTSSSEVYGDPQFSPQDESYTGNVNPQGPRANYEEGKRFAETIVALFVKKYGVDARTVRLFNAYGPRMNTDDLRVVPSFLKSIVTKQPLKIYGDGSQTRTLCYSSDIIDGLKISLRNGSPGDVYNLGGDEEVTIAELAEKMLAASGSKGEIIYEPAFIEDHKQRKPSLTKIRSLGWSQKVSLEDGLKKVLQTYSPDELQVSNC